MKKNIELGFGLKKDEVWNEEGFRKGDKEV